MIEGGPGGIRRAARLAKKEAKLARQGGERFEVAAERGRESFLAAMRRGWAESSPKERLVMVFAFFAMLALVSTAYYAAFGTSGGRGSSYWSSIAPGTQAP